MASTPLKRARTTKEERDGTEESVIQRVPRSLGRPKKFTPTKFRNRINDYFAWCEKKDKYPNIKGLMLHLGMARDQWYQYEKYPEMRPILDWARDAMESWTMNDLWKSTSSNTNKQLVAKVNHGWTEEKVITHVHMDKDQAMARLEALAPMLLEALRGQLQIGNVNTIEAELVDEVA